ncbi:MAG: imidazole glycerol phosphate synthase cyclase subunit [Pseudorhodoplanes sp.]|nr:imidazole glycerol phosphate synthase cyclase subunit [Pseudorhodoplanes sp.]GIK79311.1 MAG: imidazole glycerol phosphate synthase subunit HisF [Alphaproteobacteria bacterium]
MLKVRVIPTLLHRDVGLVKGIRFDPGRRVGTAPQAIRVYSMREVDELVFLDISATQEGRSPDFDLIDELSEDVFMPFAVGGGIRNVADVRELLRAGADKVVVNTALVRGPQIVTDIAREFGSQCVVASIDVRREDDSHRAYIACGTQPAEIEPVTLAQRAEADGAGEILLCSIDRDGMMEGYDLDIIRAVAAAVSIPVIASGGCGNYEHMAEALHAGASAVAAASMFHFTEQTPREAKLHLKAAGFSVRL